MHNAFAAIDLGTSRLRVGAMLPGGALEIIASLPNRVERAAGGTAHCRFSRQWRSVATLLQALSVWCRTHRIASLHLGLCGQVSSLLLWDELHTAPVNDSYPIWLDASCAAALPRLHSLWANGGDLRLLHTSMRPGTNWMATKLLHVGPISSPAVQVADAVFHRLTGNLMSHPSAQISLVDHQHGSYSQGMLDVLGLTPELLPRLHARGHAAMLSSSRLAYDLPATTVHVGMMDTAASIMGLAPQSKDGIFLAGTSEIIGQWTDETLPPAPANLVRLPLHGGWALYGSSASGGATLDWLGRSLLGKTSTGIARLRAAAATVPAGSAGVHCMPWPDGERAPLWDSRLTASFDGLCGHHRDAHLWRAALEGIAYVRRLGIDASERPLPPRFCAAGGGIADTLANRIRASVLNRPLLIFPQAEPALLGVIRQCAVSAGLTDPTRQSLGEGIVVEPEPAWVEVYARGYENFKAKLTSMQQESSCRTR